MDHLCYLCLVFVMLLRLFIAALWSPTGKRLTCWLSFVMFNCVFVIFPCGIHGQVWYLIVSIPDVWHLSYFVSSDLFCWCCVTSQKSLPALSVNALIIPVLRIACTVTFHYSFPLIPSLSCTIFKITR